MGVKWVRMVNNGCSWITLVLKWPMRANWLTAEKFAVASALGESSWLVNHDNP